MRRRDFLKGTLTLVGLAACGRPPQAPSGPGGAILGNDYRSGHRLWGEAPFPEPSRDVDVEVAILGGGIAGLSAGWKLIRSGLENFHIYELESSMGGNSRFSRYPESACPWAAHYLPLPTRESVAVREILSEMGLYHGDDAAGRPLYDERHLRHDPEERLFAFGRWEDGIFPMLGASQEDLDQLAAWDSRVAFWQAWRDGQGRRAFAIPLELSSPDPSVRALDRLSFLDYLKDQGFTSERVLWYLEYACRDDYGTGLSNTSAWAGLHYFASRDGGGFHPPDAVFTWPEGNGRLVSHLLSAVGGRHTTRSLVYRVENTPDGVVSHVLDLASSEAHRVRSRAAVFALPTFTRPHVMPAEPRRDEFTYSPWVTANLVLAGPPPELPQGAARLSWDNVIYQSPSLGYVVATNQSLSINPLQPTVLTWYRPFIEDDTLAVRKELLRRDWNFWRQEIMGELELVHPGLSAVARRLDVTVFGHAMIRPVPGFLWGPQRARASRPRGRVFFGHSDLSGISIFEEAQYWGVKAAEQAMTALEHPFQTSL